MSSEIVVDDVQQSSVNVIVPSSTIIEVSTGPQGPEGPEGPEGLSAYGVALANGFVGSEADWLLSLRGGSVMYWVQSSPASTWTISHSLGRSPSVTVFVSDELVYPDIYASPTQVVITFSYPNSGKALII